MSNLTSSSLAAGNAVIMENVQLQPTAEVVPRKILLVGTGDPATEAGNALDTPILVTSPEDVANQTGFGFMLHRLAIQAYLGSGGVETWMIQQAEDGAAVQAAGELDFTGSTGVLSGTLALYVVGIRVPVTITAAMTVENIADAVVAAITANDDLPVTAVKVAVTFEVTITAKSGGPWGNDIDLDFNLLSTDVTPTGVVAAVSVATASGAGIPDIQDALDALGTGDGANEAFFTDAPIHGYGQDTTTLDAIANYVGQGNTQIGLWDPIVHRPFRSLVGDTVAGSGGLSALIALGDGRKQDRANGVIAVPDSPNHPAEIAAQTLGHIARVSNDRPERNYLGILLIGILPGEKANRWTSEFNDRDTAVKAGVSPTIVKSGAVYLQNIVSFYHPDNVPVTSNGFREMRNIAILQNVAYNWAANFESANWQGKTIVSDVNKVSNINARLGAVDTDTYRNDANALLRSFEENAWLYDADFSIANLVITPRVGGDGFDAVIKLILSGMVNIINSRIQFDISLAVLL